MAKFKERLDIKQTLFNFLKNYQEKIQARQPAGSLNIDRQFREVISPALKDSPRF